MKIIGLTGGIGSGKTTVSKVFEKLGISVYYSDIQAKLLMNSESDIKKQLTQKFGEETYINHKLNRSYIADKIFNNKNNLNYINSVVHPVVRKHFIEWSEQQQTPYVINENAILFQSGFYKDTNYIISVIAPENIRIQRVLKRDHMTVKAVKSRIKNQISDEERVAKSDYTLVNNDLILILPQILKVHKILLRT